MSASYFIFKEGQQLGPYSESQIRQQIDEGILDFHDQAWMEGMEGWKPLKEIGFQRSSDLLEINSGNQNKIPSVENPVLPDHHAGDGNTAFWIIVPLLLAISLTVFFIQLIAPQFTEIIPVLACASMIGSIVWIGFDAKINRISTSKKPYSINNGSLAWVFLALLIWIIAFPAYLWKRTQSLRARGHKKLALMPVILGTVLFLVQILSLIAPLLGNSRLTVADLQTQVQTSIQEKFSKEPAFSQFQIKSFTLVHKTGNQYDGVLEGDQAGENVTLKVKVTYDGKTFMWEALP